MEDRPVVDLRAIERLREWGGEELPRKMIDLFLDHSPGRMDQIREGARTGETRNAETGAHSLKSSAGNVGAVRLQGLSEEAESRAEARDLSGLREILPALEEAFGEALEELRKILEGMNG